MQHARCIHVRYVLTREDLEPTERSTEKNACTHSFSSDGRGRTTTDRRFISSCMSFGLEEERIDLRGRWGRCRRGCTLRRTSVVHSPARCAWMIACRGRRWSVCRLGQVFNGHVITSSCVHHLAEWTTRSYNVERHEDAATGRFVRFRFEAFLLLPHLLPITMPSLRHSMNTYQCNS